MTSILTPLAWAFRKRSGLPGVVKYRLVIQERADVRSAKPSRSDGRQPSVFLVGSHREVSYARVHAI